MDGKSIEIWHKISLYVLMCFESRWLTDEGYIFFYYFFFIQYCGKQLPFKNILASRYIAYLYCKIFLICVYIAVSAGKTKALGLKVLSVSDCH